MEAFPFGAQMSYEYLYISEFKRASTNINGLVIVYVFTTFELRDKL